MKIILERNLDFRQFQNLIILIFCSIMILLGMLNSTDFGEFILMELILFFLIILFLAILFTNKGLYVQNQNFYSVIFLFGFVLKKKLHLVTEYDRLYLTRGKLSTNYNYSQAIEELHNWEPNLNISENCFSIIIINEKFSIRERILKLTKEEKVNVAINFIVENTNLMYK